MPTNIDGFGVSLNIMSQQIYLQTVASTARFAEELKTALTDRGQPEVVGFGDRTPIDTGHARYGRVPTKQGKGWQIRAVGGGGGTGQRRLPAGAPDGRGGQWTQGFDHIIFNDVPYITRLEHGWSKNQAPSGWIAATVAEFEQKVIQV